MSETYVTTAEAGTAASGRAIAAKWTALSDAQKSALLIRAAKILDSSFHWEGEPASENQTLCWPRKFVYLHGRELSSETVPGAVKDACMEQAFFMLSPAYESASGMQAAGLKSASAGGMNLNFSEDFSGIAPDAAALLHDFGVLRKRGRLTRNGFLIRA